ncbi:MAG: haloacid dehalogenase type II [Bacteroidales bacterium]
MNTPIKPKVIFLDVIETLVDITPLKQEIAKLMNNRPDLAECWFSNMLLYSLVDTLTDRLHSFREVAFSSFEMIASANDIVYDKDVVLKTLGYVSQAPAHSDVPEGLRLLKTAGYKLITLTNSSLTTVNEQMSYAGISDYIDGCISIDDIGYFKPHRHVYRRAAERMGVKPEECLLIAAHGWDIAGAIESGMQAAFIQRKGSAVYPLGPKPIYSEDNLIDLAEDIIQQ